MSHTLVLNVGYLFLILLHIHRLILLLVFLKQYSEVMAFTVSAKETLRFSLKGKIFSSVIPYLKFFPFCLQVKTSECSMTCLKV